MRQSYKGLKKRRVKNRHKGGRVKERRIYRLKSCSVCCPAELTKSEWNREEMHVRRSLTIKRRCRVGPHPLPLFLPGNSPGAARHIRPTLSLFI